MSIDIRITGTANMGGVAKELQRVQAQTAAMSKQFAAANAQMGKTGGAQAQIHNYRQWNTQMGQVRDDMIDLTRANGDFQTSSMKVGKHVDNLTDRIQKQQLGFREARKEAKALGDVYRHQLSLQNATAATWGQTMAGSSQVDLYTPNLGKQSASIDQARKKLGFYGEVLGSVATQTLNWGKNTQWAGRQLMSGFTYPLTIAAGLSAKVAYDIDKGLTQIVKVYGDSGSAVQATDEEIKESAMNSAKYLTQFGQSVTETLEIQSQLASTGKTGQELQETTQVVSKARLLGELNIQDAMKATITMQSVYGYSTDQLAEKFNFMNQMENETSLTMQDFVEGIPKVSGVMKSLDADFEDTGILLAAMKTAGIDAKEGGNAIKSMVFKDIAPSSKALKTFSEATGESLTAIVDKTKGDPVKTLQGIGEAMGDMPGEEKVAIIKEVFGIHQGSKALGMIDALTSKTGQMGKAFEIANMEASEWASTAEGELRALREADWVKTKKVIEDAKIALGEIGKVILSEMVPALATLVGGLTKVADWFQGLDSTTKKIVLWTAVITAMAGPAIMMVGLFANLGSNALKFGAGLAKAVGSMNLYTTKQKITELANQRSARSVDNLSSANMRLASSYDVLSKKAYQNLNPAGAATLDSVARKNSSRTGSPAGAGSMSVAMSGAGSGHAARTPLGMSGPMVARPGGIPVDKAAVNNTKEIAGNAAKTRASWDKIGNRMAGSAMAVGMFGSMATHSDSAMNNVSNMLFMAGMLAPMLSGPRVTGAITGMGSKMKNSLVSATAAAFLTFDRRAGKSASALGAKIKAAIAGSSTALMTGGVAGKGKTPGKAAAAGGVGALAAGAKGALGPIAIATAAFGALYYGVSKGNREAQARQDALNGSIKNTGTLLGYATDETEKFKVASKKNTDEMYISLAKRLKKDDKDLADAIKEMSSAEKSVERAVQQGIMHGQQGMVKYGWNKEEAMEAARVYAVAVNEEVAYSIDKDITVDPFVNIGQVKINQVEKIGRSIEQAMSSSSNAINGNPERGWFMSNTNQKDEHGVKHGPAVEASKLTKQGKQEIKKNTAAAWDVFSRTQGEERKKAYQLIGNSIYKGLDEVYEGLSKGQKKALEKEGVVDSHTLAKYIEANGPQAVVDHLEKSGVKMSPKSQEKMGQSLQIINEYIIQMLMEARGKNRKEIEAIYGENLLDVDVLLGTKGFKGAGRGLAASVEQNKVTLKGYKKEMDLARAARSALTKEEKDASLAAYQKEYGDLKGLMKWTEEVGGAAKATKGLTKEENARALKGSLKGSGGYGGIIKGLTDYKKKTDGAKSSTQKLTKEEELARLNKLRLAAGLKKTGNIRDGMNKKVTKTARELAIETKETDKNTKAKDKNSKAAASWKTPKNIMAGGADQEFRINNPSKEEAEAAVEKYKEVWQNVTDEMFEEVSSDLESAHEGSMDKIEKDGEAREARIDRRQEAKEAEFESRQEAIDKAFERREEKLEARWDKTMEAFDNKWENKTEKFDARWDNTMEKFDKRWDGRMEKFDSKWDNSMEKFDSKWDNTMERFDGKWERKSDAFEAKWDKTMERFEKSSEKAKEAVEKQYDARIRRIEKAIEAEQKAEEIRQKIFEKEKARIQHLSDMANRSIDINVAINTGNLDEAAKLSNDAQASIDTYEVGEAGESSQSASDKKISGLEARKGRVENQKDAAIKRIEARIDAERKALEESRKIAQKAMEIAQKRERKILEAQQKRQRKSLEIQREHERKSLEASREHQRKGLEATRNNERKTLDAQQARERKSLESQRKIEQKRLASQREATGKRLERERKIFSKEIEAARKANSTLTEGKRAGEQKRYEAAKKSLEKEMRALKAFTPRNRKELKQHIAKLEKSYGKYGYRLEKKGAQWSKSIGNSLDYHIRVARNEMSNDKRWDTLGKSIANRMTKGAFNKNVGQFMKWVEGGGGGNYSSAPSGGGGGSKKKKRRGRIAGKDSIGGMTRHKGGMIDGSKGSRAGFSGKNQSQSEVTINALKGESVLNRKATSSLGKSGVDALNKGKIPVGHDTKPKNSPAVMDDKINQRGDAPLGMSGIAGMFAAKATQMAMGKAIKEKGEAQEAEEAMDFGSFPGGSFGGSALANAAIIATVGKQLGASAREIMIALMTAIVESNLINVNYGDRDSLGLFQQRAAWGSAAARMDPRKSARMFFLGGAQGQQGLFDKSNRSSRGMGELAQAVQVSAFPERYAQKAGAARAILKSLKWGSGGYEAPSKLSYGGQTFGGGGGGARSTGNVWPGMGWQKQWAIVKKRFPNRGHPERNQINAGGHSRNSYHYKNRAIDLGSAKANGTPMSTLFNWLLNTYGSRSTQIIYGPAGGRNILNGKHFNYGAATNAAHMGHVHWAMKNGGTVPGRGSGDRTPIMGEPGEFMMKKKAVEHVGPDFLKALNSDKFINMPKTAVSNAGSAVRSDTGGVDNSYSPTYNVSIDATGNANPADVGKAVRDALTGIERRKGFDRRIGNN